MAAGGLDGITIPVLDGSNYLSWKLRMKCILELQKIDGVVYGHEKVSEADLMMAGQINSEQQDIKVKAQAALARIEFYKAKEIKARTYLTCALDAKHTSIIVACTEARSIWTRIEQEYTHTEPISLEGLLADYYTCKMEKNQSVSEYLAKIDSMVNRLAEHDRHLDDKSIMARIVSGLPQEFNGFKRIWEMTPPESRSRGLLITNLKSEERQISKTVAGGEALFSHSTSRQGRGKSFKDRNGRQKGKCDQCGSEDHLWRDCPKKPAGNGKDGRSRKGKKRGDKNQSKSDAGQEQEGKVFCASLFTGDGDSQSWFVDSGASAHMIGRRDWFSTYQTFKDPIPIKFGNKSFLHATGSGNVTMFAKVDGREEKVTLTDVHYVPNIGANLFSTGVMDDKGLEVTIKQGQVRVLHEGETVLVGHKVASRLFKLDVSVPLGCLFSRAERTEEEWHQAMGHTDFRQIGKMADGGLVDGMKIVDKSKTITGCGDCQAGKARAASHPSSSRQRAQSILERVHLDLVGKVTPTSLGGCSYFILLTDEYSSFRFAYLLRSKDKATVALKAFFDSVSTITQRKVKILRSDNGSEFRNETMSDLCLSEGVIQEFSSPYCPQQNGEAERSNRTIIETARSMLQASDMAPELWAEAINCAVYVRNRVPSSRTGDKTPFELFYGLKPDVSHLMPFGQEVHVLNKRKSAGKFASRTFEGFLVGYDHRVNTYRCFVPSIADVVVSPHVVPASHKAKSTFPSPSASTVFVIENNGSGLDDSERDQADASPPQLDPQDSDEQSSSPDQIDLPDVDEQQARAHCTMDEDDIYSNLMPIASGSADQVAVRAPATEESQNAPRRQQSVFERLYQNAQELNSRQMANRGAGVQPSGAGASRYQLAPMTMPAGSTKTTAVRRVLFQDADCDAAADAPLAPTRTTSLDQQVQVPLYPTLSAPMPVASTSRGGGQTVAHRSPLKKMLDKLPGLKQKPTVDARQQPKRNVQSKYMRGMISEIDVCEPTSYREAVSCDNAADWSEAIDAELKALSKNSTWAVVPKPADKREISAKWVFKLKQRSDGSIERFKARLVARGFDQTQGVDYGEIFAPVVRMDSIRLLFALAAQLGLKWSQFDVATAFLHGDVKEELYLRPPDGVRVPDGHTLRLRKSLYGLKQAPRCWNDKFKRMLKTFKLTQSLSDPCVFVGHETELIYLALYVDDGLIFARNQHTIDKLIDYLKEHLEVKLIDADCFIGLQIQKGTNGSIFLHQSAYIDRLITKFGMRDSKPKATPMEANHSLSKVEEFEHEPIAEVPYAELLGSLMYAAVGTRPDISYAVSVLSKFTKSPRERHWKGLKRVVRYLQGTPDYGLVYERVDKPRVVCYVDADWAGDHQDRKSTSGMVTQVAGGVVTYKAQKQASVALSTTEAEYIAAATAIKDLIWIKQFLGELQVPVKMDTAVRCDNQSAIRLIKNPEFHQRSKHIALRYHFIRDCFAEGIFDLAYIPTEDQKADIFTKSLGADRHAMLRDAIGCGRLVA